MTDCIFCRIIRGEIASKKVFENDEMLAFHDIHPLAPVHFMIVPKKHIASLSDSGEEDAGVLGRMLAMAGPLARKNGSPEGFRTIINTGRVGRQDVYHLHIHIIGGPNPLPAMIARD